jgi:hypothetical protein
VLERTLLSCQATLLIIDPLSRALGDTSSCTDHDLFPQLAPLAELCERLQVTCILVHRLTGSTPATLARSSLASSGLTCISWLLERDPEQPQIRLLRQVHNHLQDPAPTLRFTIISDQTADEDPHPALCWLDSDPNPSSLASADPATTSTRQAILDFLHTHAPQAFSIQQLHDALPQTSRNNLRVTIGRMAKNHQIHKVAFDAYTALSTPPQDSNAHKKRCNP